MTVGRLSGDELNRKLGATRLIRAGTTVAAFALGGLLLIGIPAIAIAGFFLVGLGIANGAPLLFSAVGNEAGREPGPNIAAVSFAGSLGILVGPPFIGFLADATSLPIALSMLCPGLVVVALFARGAPTQSRATSAPRGASAPGPSAPYPRGPGSD
jgi:predicted MFS family arabinose efflux permease